MKPPTDGAAILENAREVRPILAEAAERIDAARRLPDDILALLKATGVFRVFMPLAWGGPEVDPMTQVRIFTELSAGSGSAGWTAMIGCDGGFYTTFLDDAVAREMWKDMDTPTGSTAFPPGRAVAVEGGYLVSGRWAYGSGCDHSGWMAGSCVIFDGETPRRRESGTPEILMAFVPAGSFEIIDTWHTTGMRGSGSKDWELKECFVPAERCRMFNAPSRRDRPLYRFNQMFLAKQSGVALGIGRCAIDEVLRVAETKRNVLGGSMRDLAHVQAAVGLAEARLAASEGYVMGTLSDAWTSLERAEPLSPRQRAHMRLCVTHSHKEVMRLVEDMYEVAGGSALYTPSVLDRCLRDIRTANQHVVVTMQGYQQAGLMFMGGEPPAMW